MNHVRSPCACGWCAIADARVAVTLLERGASAIEGTAASDLGRNFHAQEKRLPGLRTAPSPTRWSGWRRRSASGGRSPSGGPRAAVTRLELYFERIHRVPRPLESRRPSDTEG